jgi:hypothetical protein
MVKSLIVRKDVNNQVLVYDTQIASIAFCRHYNSGIIVIPKAVLFRYQRRKHGGMKAFIPLADNLRFRH